MNKLVIVARYNEELGWVENINADVVIFNKGNDWPYDFPRTNLENKGREAETFIYSIISLYETIENYDYMIFLQGNPFDHFSDTINIVNNYNQDEIFPLTNNINPCNFTDRNYVFGKHLCLVQNFFNPEKKLKAHFKNHKDIIEISEKLGKEFLIMRFICLICGISLEKLNIAWPGGAQYIVPVRFIKNKSKKWWIDLYRLFEYMTTIIQPGELTAECIFERLWLLFYTHEEHDNNILLPSQQYKDKQTEEQS